MAVPASPQLEVHALACRREERLLFQGLGFELRAGQALQVEGPNGSGKTTLLRVLCALTRPEAGEVRWGGAQIQENLPDYLGRLLYIGHHAGIKEELTPLENLAFAAALAPPRAGVSVEDALERIGLPAACDEVPCRKLSAGQRRRVALARLLLSDAALWVLDEPFTALDRAGRQTIEHVLQEHLQRGGMAVITTHHALDLGGCTVKHLHLS